MKRTLIEKAGDLIRSATAKRSGTKTSTKIAAKPLGKPPVDFQGMDPEMAKTLGREVKRKGLQKKLAGR